MKVEKVFKKTVLLIGAIFLCGLSNSFAVEVDKTELQSVTDTIVFENYTGPHKVVDSLDDIKGIGTSIGASFDKTASGTYGNTAKYYVLMKVLKILMLIFLFLEKMLRLTTLETYAILLLRI